MTSIADELRQAAQNIRSGAEIPARLVAAWLTCVAIDDETEPESGPRIKERHIALKIARAINNTKEPTS